MIEVPRRPQEHDDIGLCAKCGETVIREFEPLFPGPVENRRPGIVYHAEAWRDAVHKPELEDARQKTDTRFYNVTPITISEIGLSTRAANTLMREGIETLETLTEWSEARLLNIRTFGAGALAEVQTALAARGLTLTSPHSTAWS